MRFETLALVLVSISSREKTFSKTLLKTIENQKKRRAHDGAETGSGVETRAVGRACAAPVFSELAHNLRRLVHCK